MDGKTRGRQKINLAKIENENHLQVTFSKRRAGVFKKANELATLCGAQVGILVFSPGKKAFSFGHPNVESVLDRFLSHDQDPGPRGLTEHLLEARRDASVRELNKNLTSVEGLLESERKRSERLAELKQAAQALCHPRGTPIDDINNVEQLEQLKAAMEELKVKVGRQVAQGLPPALLPTQQPNPLEDGHCLAIVPFHTNAAEFDASTSAIPPGFSNGNTPGFP